MESGGHAPEVRVLTGTVSITGCDGAMEEPAGNTARLLALLVSRADQPVSVAEIIRAVWPDLDPDLVARQQVERLVSGLRDLLGEGARDIIPVRKHDRYRLDASTGCVWVDSVEFVSLAHAAQGSLESGDVAAAHQHATEALALWQSDPVVLPDEWMDLKRRRRTVLLVGAQAQMQAGEHGRAAAELAAFVQDHPDDEAVWKLLVEAHVANGEQVLAAQACAEAARRFSKFGGMGPKLTEICQPLAASSDPTAAPAGGDPGPMPDSQPAAQPQPDAGQKPRPRAAATALRVSAVLLAGTLIAGLAVFLASRGDEHRGPALVTVYNQEAQCQRPRTRTCRLGLAHDPYANYTPQNIAGHVWHGDVLNVDCFVADGARVESEDGTPSTRWYRVTASPHVSGARRGAQGWLPGTRVRPGTEPAVQRCTDV